MDTPIRSPAAERDKTRGLTGDDGFDSNESDAIPIDGNDNICNRPEDESRRPQQSSPTEPQGFTSQRPQQPQFTQQQRQPQPQAESWPQEKPYDQNNQQQYFPSGAEYGKNPRKENKNDNHLPGFPKNCRKPTVNIPCKTVVDAKTKKLVCREIGYNWKRLARELNLEDYELEEVEYDYHRDGLREMAFKMFDTWCRKYNDEATVEVLASALREIGRADIALKIESGKS